MILQLALSALLVLGPANEPALATVEQAEAAFAAHRYEEAAAAYAAVYEATGDIAYLFARAEAERLAGRCADALKTYEAFIATRPKPEAVTFAEERIELCRAELPTPTPAPAPDVTPPTARDAAETAPPRAAPKRPWHRDPAGASLVAVGLAGLATGTVLAAVARASQNAAERATTLAEYGERNDRAVVLSRAAIPVLAVGGALLLAGIVRYALVARPPRSRTARAALGPGLVVRF